MTEVNHCYENVIYTIFLTTPCCAARINKTLKFEFGLRYTFNDFKEAQSAIKQAVFLYNNVRLHQHLEPVSKLLVLWNGNYLLVKWTNIIQRYRTSFG
ncbi:integrase core domain-containing protein, partial [Leptospira santarosai]